MINRLLAFKNRFKRSVLHLEWSESQTTIVEDGSNWDQTKLDIVFLQDTTASQGPYIEAAKKAIKTICDKVSQLTDVKPEDIRFGLIAFRDHPPQDKTYITLDFGSSGIHVMESNLQTLGAHGGGDGPEAVTAALFRGLNMPWEVNAAKMVVLITDAPPHGIGELYDGFDSSPDQNDPLELARQMARQGITLFVVACEPTLSTTYRNTVDFYAALVEITGGKMLPLTLVDQLGDFIASTVVETIQTDTLIKKYQKHIVNNVYSESKTLDDVVDEMHEMLQEKKVEIHKTETDNIYFSSPKSEGNKRVWMSAKNLSAARSKIIPVSGKRLVSKAGVSDACGEPLRPRSPVDEPSDVVAPMLRPTPTAVPDDRAAKFSALLGRHSPRSGSSEDGDWTDSSLRSSPTSNPTVIEQPLPQLAPPAMAIRPPMLPPSPIIMQQPTVMQPPTMRPTMIPASMIISKSAAMQPPTIILPDDSEGPSNLELDSPKMYHDLLAFVPPPSQPTNITLSHVARNLNPIGDGRKVKNEKPSVRAERPGAAPEPAPIPITTPWAPARPMICMRPCMAPAHRAQVVVPTIPSSGDTVGPRVIEPSTSVQSKMRGGLLDREQTKRIIMQSLMRSTNFVDAGIAKESEG